MARKRKRRGGTVGDKTGGYEKLREQRMKENRERMHKLGIFYLSLKLKPSTDKNSRNVSSAGNKTRNPRPLSEPPRRSTREKHPKRSILSGDKTVIDDKDESFVDVNIRQDEEEGQNCRKNSLREADFDGKRVEMKRVQWMDFLGKELVEIREFSTRPAWRGEF